MKKLENCISLNHKIKIYVPTTINVVESFDNSAFVRGALTLLGEAFNGATSYEAFGSWLTAQGKLVYEKITICESFCTERSLELNIDAVYSFCKTLKIEMKQEAIALEVDNVMYFV